MWHGVEDSDIFRLSSVHRTTVTVTHIYGAKYVLKLPHCFLLMKVSVAFDLAPIDTDIRKLNACECQQKHEFSTACYSNFAGCSITVAGLCASFPIDPGE